MVGANLPSRSDDTYSTLKPYAIGIPTLTPNLNGFSWACIDAVNSKIVVSICKFFFIMGIFC